MADVLLVDDDYDSSAALAKLLQRGGHEVRHVPDGHRALSAVIERRPDTVVLDLKMPLLDGVGFLEIMRSYLRLSDVPVVLLTGCADESRLQQAEKFRVKRVFTKGRDSIIDIVKWINDSFSPGPTV